MKSILLEFWQFLERGKGWYGFFAWNDEGQAMGKFFFFRGLNSVVGGGKKEGVRLSSNPFGRRAVTGDLLLGLLRCGWLASDQDNVRGNLVLLSGCGINYLPVGIVASASGTEGTRQSKYVLNKTVQRDRDR